MMRALLLVLLLAAMPAQAAPFLVADVSPDADRCLLTGLPSPVVLTADESAGACRWDLAGLPVGSYTVTAVASNLWGASVPSAPFTFARPPSTSIPAGLRLVP